MEPETGIVIRARNEERWIGTVLDRIEKQTYQNFEIIVVDSGSRDTTLEIVSRHPNVKLVHILPEEFTYPKAINIGIEASSATKYFVILSAHSVPIGTKWLESAIDKFSLQKNVMGVYGPLKAMPDGTIMDTLIHNIAYYKNLILAFPKGYIVSERDGGGVLGFTNAIIRKDLYEQYPINNTFAGGGEDNDWLRHWLSKGYVAIRDMNFAVHHSHYLGVKGWIKQFQHWKGNSTPQPFAHLPYRKDGAHAPIVQANK